MSSHPSSSVGRIQAASFLEASVGALASVLPEVYAGIDSPEALPQAYLCGNQNFLRKMYQISGTNSQRSLPFFAYTISNFSLNHSSYNRGLQKVGTKIGILLNGQDWLLAHLTPITVTVTVAFIGDSYNQFMQFSARWLQKQRDLSFTIQVEETGESVIIQVRGNEQLNAPVLEQDQDNGELFIYETTLTMDTYTGYFERRPRVLTINGNLVPVSQTDFADLAQQQQDYRNGLNATPVINAQNNIPFLVRVLGPRNPEL